MHHGLTTAASVSLGRGEPQQQPNSLAMANTCYGAVPPNNRSKYMSTTRCEGYVGSRIASRYDEDEEDDDGGAEEADPDGTIPEEDEEAEEEQADEQGNTTIREFMV
uniref:Uncharacterized protein n=1 Tax=Anopheles minimus TaxID=112268 RepID=A0A182WA02_9DIPT